MKEIYFNHVQALKEKRNNGQIDQTQYAIARTILDNFAKDMEKELEKN